MSVEDIKSQNNAEQGYVSGTHLVGVSFTGGWTQSKDVSSQTGAAFTAVHGRLNSRYVFFITHFNIMLPCIAVCFTSDTKIKKSEMRTLAIFLM